MQIGFPRNHTNLGKWLWENMASNSSDLAQGPSAWKAGHGVEPIGECIASCPSWHVGIFLAEQRADCKLPFFAELAYAVPSRFQLLMPPEWKTRKTRSIKAETCKTIHRPQYLPTQQEGYCGKEGMVPNMSSYGRGSSARFQGSRRSISVPSLHYNAAERLH